MSENTFIEELHEISKGERALLKRNIGKMPGDSDGKAVMLFYRLLPYGVAQKQEPVYFAVACISALWDSEAGRPIEQCFAEIRKESDTIENRIAMLIDMKWDEDGFFLAKLSRLIKLVYQKGYCVDCEKLLKDLLYWNNDRQYVQKKWAKALYINEKTDDEEEKNHVI